MLRGTKKKSPTVNRRASMLQKKLFQHRELLPPLQSSVCAARFHLLIHGLFIAAGRNHGAIKDFLKRLDSVIERILSKKIAIPNDEPNLIDSCKILSRAGQGIHEDKVNTHTFERIRSM